VGLGKEETAADGAASAAPAGAAAAAVAAAGAAVAAAAQHTGSEGEAEVSQEELRERLQTDFSALLAVVREAQAADEDPAEVLQERQLVPDVVQYALALRALRLEEQFKAALQLFAAMEGVLTPDVAVYAEILGIHVAMGFWTRVIDTFTRMRRQGILPNLSCYNCVMRVHAECRNARKAAELLLEMKQDDLMPDLTSYELAFRACNGKHGEKCLDVMSLMEAQRLKPSATCYRRAIRSLGRLSMWDRGAALFDDMRSRNIEIDEHTLNVYLCACMSAPNPGTAASVFKRIEADAGITVSELHYDTVICACEKEGNWPEVVALAARMGANGVDPHMITCSSVLTACVELGKWEAALSLLSSIRGDDTATGTLDFAISEVLRACVNAGQWDEVVRLHTELRQLRRGLDADGPDMVDVRGLPPEVAGTVVRSTLQEAVQRLAESEGGGTPTGSSAGSSAHSGPQDVVVLVETDNLVSESWGAPGMRRAKTVMGTAAASAVVVAIEELGREANLQCLTQPFPCIRIPGVALESPLLQQRVQKAVSDFALGAGQPSEKGVGEGGEADHASNGVPRSI